MLNIILLLVGSHVYAENVFSLENYNQTHKLMHKTVKCVFIHKHVLHLYISTFLHVYTYQHRFSDAEIYIHVYKRIVCLTIKMF